MNAPLPVAEIVAVHRPTRRGECWVVTVACPYCGHLPRPRGWAASEWGRHGHGIGAPSAEDFPRLGPRVADCGGGTYTLGPLPEVQP